MKNNLLAASVLALGLTLLGIFIYSGIRRYADKDRVVDVKGLATRSVQADHAVWPLNFAVKGNDISLLYDLLLERQQMVVNFLKEKGFDENDISKDKISVADNWNSYYGTRPEYHYTLSTSVTISTDDVDLVKKNDGCQSELLARGFILSSWSIDYLYNGLSELKPEMIKDATKNARAVAQKFADDAGCHLGSIQSASQGYFSVDQDKYEPWMQNIRVVTTVSYYLR